MLLETDNTIPSLKLPEMTISSRRNEKLNSGRWKPNEHDKFLEAIIIHGNDWKLVQKCIKSRSSTQARSHAQKFLLKLRKKLKIEPDNNNKLSNESIDKIVKEIIDNSCLRNSTTIDKEKLVKLIIGFSNLLVGKLNSQSGLPENINNNNYYLNNQDSYFDGNYPLQNSFFKSECSEGGKKVFNIEKVYKSDRKLSNTFSNAETILTEKSKRSENISQIFNSEAPKGTFQINQIYSQNDLLKYLFQNPQPDPSNPNKNVINIISINILNKNEGENNVPINNLNSTFLNQNSDNNSTSNSQRKTILNILGTSLQNNNNLKLVSTTPLIIPTKGVVTNKDVQIAITKLDELKTDVNNLSVNNKTAVSSSPDSNNFEHDFYENPNSSQNCFNHIKSDEDEYDKFFDWN